MDGQAVHAVAAALVQQRGAELGFGRNDVARQRSVFVDELGQEHVRFDREYHGLPVIGGDFIVHPAEREDEALTAQIMAPIPVSHVPTLTSAQAIAVGERAFSGVRQGKSDASLVIYAVEGAAQMALAYDVVTSGIALDGTPSILHSFVDAHSGRLLLSYDEIETTGATGSGHGLYTGVVTLNDNHSGANYDLTDTTRGNGQTVDASNGNKLFTATSNTWGSGTTTNKQSAAVDAHYGAAMTWDYYKTTHSRTGIANDGKSAQSRVHYGTSYNNAFWSDSCFCMTYGDGDGKLFSPLVALDVTGHEMTHGVTSRTARLIYAGEPGGLNEGSSDIMGISVKFFAKNATTPGNYLLGDKLVVSGTNKFLRSMSDPKADGHSVDNYSLYKSSLDVHYASGIANNFFYLLSEGGTNHTSGKTVKGITRAKAEKIWYRALTSYFTSSTNYSAARKASVKAAADLFGGAASAEAVAVGAVWDAVGVK
jgi:Zn-dependent metalloprotease